jgi:hypothetical protein
VFRELALFLPSVKSYITGQRGAPATHPAKKDYTMKTITQRRSLALSLLCAVGLSFAAATAHAAEPVSDLARLDGGSAHVGKVDPFLDGARIGKPDPFTDGARIGKPDPFTDGARIGKPDPFTDGA